MRPTPPEFDTTKMSWLDTMLNKKNIAVLLVMLFGGGGVAAWDVATKNDVKEAIVEHAVQQRAESDARYQRIDSVVEQQGSDIGKIKVKVGDIQNVQQRQIARQEARRLTSGIKNRNEREQEYDRLLERNLRRLEAGRDPCSTLVCNN
ncbi:MAG: hypothetical protein GY854_02140 [Deltaproteobacteria bacterium]|nr:hypothetical protein [Deltaproteobacteria bacterium]